MKVFFDRIISLGGDCSIAGSLRDLKYKEASYMFDWVVSDIDFVIKSFETEFKIFDNLFKHCVKSGNGQLKYDDKIYFYHDSPIVNNEIKQKYIRRSNNLKKLLNSGKKILFVRKSKNDGLSKIKKLKNIIKKTFPSLSFKILLINNIKENNNDKDIIHIYKSSIECFLNYDNKKDIYSHMNQKKSYKVAFDEINKFISIKIKQLPKYS